MAYLNSFHFPVIKKVFDDYSAPLNPTVNVRGIGSIPDVDSGSQPGHLVKVARFLTDPNTWNESIFKKWAAAGVRL
jgi:hypothetical protein